MPLAPTDPIRVAGPDNPKDMEARGYGWYDPDAAAFDPLSEPDETDEDLNDLDWG